MTLRSRSGVDMAAEQAAAMASMMWASHGLLRSQVDALLDTIPTLAPDQDPDGVTLGGVNHTAPQEPASHPNGDTPDITIVAASEVSRPPPCPSCGHRSRVVQRGCFANYHQCFDFYGDVKCLCVDDYHYASHNGRSVS